MLVSDPDNFVSAFLQLDDMEKRLAYPPLPHVFERKALLVRDAQTFGIPPVKMASVVRHRFGYFFFVVTIIKQVESIPDAVGKFCLQLNLIFHPNPIIRGIRFQLLYNLSRLYLHNLYKSVNVVRLSSLSSLRLV